MGLPMGAAMMRAGIPVTGFDVRRDDAFPGLPMEFDAVRFAADLTHLFTVVRDQAQTEALLFDQQAVLTKAPALEALVICSTLPPRYMTELQQRVPPQITVLEAPMSGAAIAAEEARLTFMTGGPRDAVDEIQLMLAAMGDRFHYMGDLGAAMAAKVLNNLVAASSMAATRTALNWAEKAGIDRDALLAVMNDSSGQTWLSLGFDAIEFAPIGFEAENTLGIMVKDIAATQTLSPDDTRLIDALTETLKGLKPLKN